MKLSEIQQKLKAPKNQRNNFGNYNYRNCEDILEALKPLLGDAVVTISDEIVQVGDRFYVKATAEFFESENHENGKTVTAFARESFDKKGMDAAQITGAASSYARKYALNGLFLIDDTKDADSDGEAMKPYEVPRKVPAADDEAQGKRNYPEMDETNDVAPLKEMRNIVPKKTAKQVTNEKMKIVRLLHEKHGFVSLGKKKEEVAAKVLELTNYELEEENYEAILDRLNV